MIKLMIGLLIIACLALFFIKGPSGEPLMSLEDLKTELPTSVAELITRFRPASEAQPPAIKQIPARVYKWQDDQGQWHFSSAPPNPDLAEEVEIGEINLMDAYVPPAEVETETTTVSQLPTGSATATPNQVKEMMDTVTNLQETIDQRKVDMDAIAAPL